MKHVKHAIEWHVLYTSLFILNYWPANRNLPSLAHDLRFNQQHHSKEEASLHDHCDVVPEKHVGREWVLIRVQFEGGEHPKYELIAG